MAYWIDFFAPRRLLTNTAILEELRSAQAKARATLPPDEAEAVAVYLSVMMSKVVDYNGVNTFWHTGSHAPMHTFSRHDFAFRPAFCEIEGAHEVFGFASSQVLTVYGELADLVHGVGLAANDEEESAEDGEPADDDGSEDDDAADGAAAATVSFRPEVVAPTVTCNDAAALETPGPDTVHLICVDPPYYSNVQYSELSNFFYVWLKRALHDWPGLEPLFREELAEWPREAVANVARWRQAAGADGKVWQLRYEAALAELQDARDASNKKLKKPDRERVARERAGPLPATAMDRADKFYEDRMAAVFRRAKQLLHPAGRMVVMFNHKMTKAWRALGAALIREGFDIRTSVPVHTEAESSLHIRGLDAARSTVLLLCLPREETGQVTGNWGRVQSQVALVARRAAERFQQQGLSGTDLYLSALGPALGEVGRHWPITDMAGRPIDLAVALDEAYRAVGHFRLEQILTEMTRPADGPAAARPERFAEAVEGFSAESVDKNTQTLWLWLDTFQGDVADSDDVRKLAKSLDIEPDSFGPAAVAVGKGQRQLHPQAPAGSEISACCRGTPPGRRRADGPRPGSARGGQLGRAEVPRLPGCGRMERGRPHGRRRGGSSRAGGAQAVAAQLWLRRGPQLPGGLRRYAAPAAAGVRQAPARRRLAGGRGAGGNGVEPGDHDRAEVISASGGRKPPVEAMRKEQKEQGLTPPARPPKGDVMDRFWLLTSTTYGHVAARRDPRGFVSNVSPTTAERESATTSSACPCDADMPGLRRYMRRKLQGPPIYFRKEQAETVLAQFQETAAYREWWLLAAAVMANHFHVVVGVPGDPDPEKLLGDFKSYASRALNRRFGKPASGTWWTESGSKRKKSDRTAVLEAVEYVRTQPYALVVWINEEAVRHIVGEASGGRQPPVEAPGRAGGVSPLC